MPGSRALDHRCERFGLDLRILGAHAALELEIERDARSEAIEHLAQQRDALAAARVERAHLGQARVGDLSAAAEPGEILVVRDHHRRVARAVQVDLDHVGALRDGELVGRQRILRALARRAAVRDHERSRRPHAGTQSRARSTARFQPA